MKKVLYILNDGLRKFTYEWVAGLYRAIQRADEPINLYIMRSDGYFAFDPGHNCGEFNIFRLPDYRDFDGVFLDINTNLKGGEDDYAVRGARYAIQAAASSGRPVISMANYIDGFYYVGIDNYAAMTSVIHYLHEELGLSDFWFAMGPEDSYENQMRAQALLDYCRDHGLPCGEERFYGESFIVESGMHAFRELRARSGGRLPQAMICANDQIAVGVCRAAEAAGCNVPRDFMVTGFDNLDISAYLTPSITTVDQQCWTMGGACVDTMLKLWRGEDVPRVVYTPTQLLPRESTGSPSQPPADVKSRVSEFISRGSSATEFGYKLSTLQYQLPSCRSMREMCLALVRCVSTMHCKGLYLVLDRELRDYGNRFDLNERPARADAAEGLPAEGYPGTMDLVFAWEAGKEPRFPKRRVGSSLSTKEPKGPRENHLFAPIHFKERTVGYLAIWECVDMLRINCISSVVNTFTMALRSYFASRKLSYVNRMLSGISMKDELTGLYNRLGFHQLAPRLFERTREAGGRLGILFVDMDRLKYINDNYGHAGGDQAIVCVANAIRKSAPREAVPVRFGGDEFLVLTPVAGAAEAEAVIDGILMAIAAEAEAMGVTDVPGISAGYALTEPGADKTLDEYVAEADERMYREKKQKGCERA